ncbi:V-type ATPase 116kDa subunit family protein [Thiocapsa sp.]|uniref:V-type ATPase 116kDa subunit family protein n=1 Tax=Thiocapsa sp. TaxID=2024551 RepID=UPI0025CD98A6|nr:V-type ATPase 116kDa subunit family protein [Thiocapsa sp.]
MLRPASTRWFEVLCPRRESVRTVTELARTGAVEIEIRDRVCGDFPLEHLSEGLGVYEALRVRYGRYWERARLRRKMLVESPDVVLERALARIGAWRCEADPLIDILQSCEEELTRLKWLAQVIGKIIDSPLDFGAVARSGPVLGTFCAVLPRDARPQLPDDVIPRQIPWGDEYCAMILGPRDRLDAVKRLVQAAKGRVIERPPWLKGDARDSLARIGARRDFLSTRVVYLKAELDTLFDEFDLGDTLGEVAGLAWFAGHVGCLERAGEHLVWVTGWTDDLSGERLRAALEAGRTRALLRLTKPPPGKRPPQILDNPPWMRPFELFARALGVPGSDEADPTPLLLVVVPLLFGYMFGDVGQGAVLLGVGLWLQRRWPEARLLVLGGVSAMVFGVLFGSLFGREDIIPALWMHPLHDPLTLLGVPLLFAVALLSLGHLLSGLSALWRGELGRWLMQDLGFLVLYLGLIATVLRPGLGWVALLGLAWYLIGAFMVHRALLGGLAAIGHLLESGVQILVNTLSFARVGAFALAHSALSVAVVTMADSVPLWAGILIMILGNVLIILLEGLVVSIQTTRLVLFEFFNRFLQGTGRVFRPLPAPPPIVREAVQGSV